MDSKLGFKKAETRQPRRRVIISLEGPEKTGKSHFSLTAPGPLAYFDSDLGTEGVVDKFVEAKDIYLYEVKTAKEIILNADANGPQIDAEKEFAQFKRAYYASLDDGEVRSIVVDTATETWELLRLAFFGKLAQVPPMKYGPANEEYRRLIRAAYDSYKSLILIHRVKDEYLGTIDAKGRDVSVRTGKKLRSGFGDTGYLVQANITTYYDRESKEFGIEVRDCRQNMGLAGEKFQGEIEGVGSMCSFPFLASSIFPGTDMEEWK